MTEQKSLLEQEKKELLELMDRFATALHIFNMSTSKLNQADSKFDKIINLLKQINNQLLVQHDRVK